MCALDLKRDRSGVGSSALTHGQECLRNVVEGKGRNDLIGYIQGFALFGHGLISWLCWHGVICMAAWSWLTFGCFYTAMIGFHFACGLLG